MDTSVTRTDSSQRLLDSAAALSYDPATEVDWAAPLDPAHHGLNPEWSTLFGTRLWEEMTPEQRVTLTRHEVASIMSTGIWFEMILQQMVLRDHYCTDYSRAGFQFALTEIADECRHSIMFARACATMGVPAHLPSRTCVHLGRAFGSLAVAEVAYGGILVAEEVLDVMQRDWMRGADVLPVVRATSRIHVVEESRHMKFARQEMRARLEGAGRARRAGSALVVAVAAHVIVSAMVSERVYAAAGLDTARALHEARTNEHRKTLMRSSCVPLMAFLDELGLLTRPARHLYQRVSMV